LSCITRLGIELLIAIWQHDPRLLAAGPDVNGRPQPGWVIECAAEDARTIPCTSVPGRGCPQTHVAQSGQTQRRLTRPLSAMLSRTRGALPDSRSASSSTRTPMAKALPDLSRLAPLGVGGGMGPAFLGSALGADCDGLRGL
jgi:hypothetical protein